MCDDDINDPSYEPPLQKKNKKEEKECHDKQRQTRWIFRGNFYKSKGSS